MKTLNATFRCKVLLCWYEGCQLSKNLKTLEAIERDYIVGVLEQTHWKVSGTNSAAEILDLNRSTLRARMRKLGIQKP